MSISSGRPQSMIGRAARKTRARTGSVHLGAKSPRMRGPLDARFPLRRPRTG